MEVRKHVNRQGLRDWEETCRVKADFKGKQNNREETFPKKLSMAYSKIIAKL